MESHCGHKCFIVCVYVWLCYLGDMIAHQARLDKLLLIHMSMKRGVVTSIHTWPNPTDNPSLKKLWLFKNIPIRFEKFKKLYIKLNCCLKFILKIFEDANHNFCLLWVSRDRFVHFKAKILVIMIHISLDLF